MGAYCDHVVESPLKEVVAPGKVGDGVAAYIGHPDRSATVPCETYYQSWGKTWERQAMIKARVSAGSDSLGREFFGMMEPFIYRRSLDFEAIEKIKSMKNRINKSITK